MSEAIGIETRSRSRSKTPGLLFGENGDSHEKKAKKIPTISLIEEEDDVVEVVSSQQSQASQKPKRTRRSGKASQADQSDPLSQESPKNSQTVASNKQSIKSTTTTTTSTTIVTSKQTINGNEEKNGETTTSSTKVVTTVNNDIAAVEAPESQNIFNNIFNAIKTSTPILSNKRSTRITQETKSSSEIDYNAHPAYKEYKEAGEYWNKYPKTDYTYSELSPHRRELGRGVVAMPNMSRRSLDNYVDRVESMIQKKPTEESFLRRKFLSNMSYQKRSADLQYDSADEVDVSDVHLKYTIRNHSQTNFFRRFFLLIVSTFSSVYSNAKQGLRRIYYGKNQRYLYTPIKQQNQGVLRGVYNALQNIVLFFISKVYLFISSILCLDTWILYTRSENVGENRKRKRFLLGLLILLPLLIFGGTYIFIDPPQNISFPKLTLPKLTFPKISLPSFSLPKISLNLSWLEFSWPLWLKWPSFSFEWPSFSFEWLSFSLPSWFRLPNFSFSLPDFSFNWPEFSFSWPSWLALPTLTWPVWLTLPEISFSLPEWLKWPEFSFSKPEWLQLPSFSFSWPEISFSYPEWLKLPEFSMPSISFEFLTPVATYTADTFSSLKSSTIEFFDKICDATTGALNEVQIVWNENFNTK